MTDFTYELPNEAKYLEALCIMFGQKDREDLAYQISWCTCEIIDNGSFSEYRWNGHYTTVNFQVPMDIYTKFIKCISSDDKQIILNTCREVMPEKTGLDVMEINFKISLKDTERKDAFADLKKATEEVNQKIRTDILPEDIKTRAKEMSEVYLYTYCAENALRAFIVNIAQKHYGVDYLTGLKLNSKMKEKIGERKGLQEKKKWLSVRGDSDIYYLDIDDLAKVISGNWDIFKQYFESYEWISTNIKEIGDCRNAVAHHSYLQQHERDIIRLDFIKILKQISDSFT